METKDPRQRYHPVAILNSMSKLLEKIVAELLMSFMKSNHLFPQQQHGYRAFRGTGTANATLHAKLKRLRDQGHCVRVISFDLSSVFDTVSTEALQKSLQEIGIGEGALKWFQTYMESGYQSTNWNDALSSFLHIKYGIRQGSLLGPLLYCIVTLDAPSALGLWCLLYADDLSALRIGRKRLMKLRMWHLLLWPIPETDKTVSPWCVVKNIKLK